MNSRQPSNTSVIIRFVILGVLWLWLAGTILVRVRPLTAYHFFVIAASAIIVFVPMYKKYCKSGK